MATFCTKQFSITVGQLGFDDLDDKAFCVGEVIPDQTVFAMLNVGAGAVEPFTWEIIEGEAALTAAGFAVGLDAGIEPDEFYFTLSGTPAAAGSVTFTVQVRDDAAPDNNVAEREFTVWAAKIDQATEPVTTPLPSAAAGVSYVTTLTQTGAPAPVRFGILNADQPAFAAAGFTLNTETGAITAATPVAGTVTFRVVLSSIGAD